MDDAVDHLYAVPLEEFVKERTRLSRELRKQDRSAAAELAKLPKPSAPAWALNHIAREDPEAMGEWLGTADALREASNRAAELGGDTVRGAMGAHRESTRRLTEVVREQARPGGKELSEAMLRRVTTLLQAATADEEVAERLRAGRITEDAAEDDGRRRGGDRLDRDARAEAHEGRAQEEGGDQEEDTGVEGAVRRPVRARVRRDQVEEVADRPTRDRGVALLALHAHELAGAFVHADLTGDERLDLQALLLLPGERLIETRRAQLRRRRALL